MKYDVIIIGAGPSGIFCAYELLKEKPDLKVLMIEKGRSIESRQCPKRKTKKCVNCKPCSITTGFAGAAAFSDGKLSLLGDVHADQLVNAALQNIVVLFGKCLNVDNDTGFAVRNTYGRIADLTDLLTEDRAVEAFFRRKLRLALRRDLTDQNISGSNFRTDADYAELI